MKAKNRKQIQKKEYIQKNKAEVIDEKTGTQVLDSVLERDTLNDFLYNAELRQQQFEVLHIFTIIGCKSPQTGD